MLNQTVDSRTEAIVILNQKIEHVYELILVTEDIIKFQICFDGKASDKRVRTLKEQKVRLADLLEILEILDPKNCPKWLRSWTLS